MIKNVWQEATMMSTSYLDNGYNLRSGITIFTDQDNAIDDLLTELVTRCPAKLVLLIDVSGQIVSAQGDRGDINLVALGSLIAGDLAASQEIARLTQQYQNYQLIMREGPHANTFIAEAGHNLVLFVQVSNEVPLGWARLLITNAAHQLEAIMNAPPESVGDLNLGLDDENLEESFSNALDALWME